MAQELTKREKIIKFLMKLSPRTREAVLLEIMEIKAARKNLNSVNISSTQRKVVSKRDLLELLKAETSKFDICSNIYIGQIKEVAVPQEECNWTLVISGGNKEETA